MTPASRIYCAIDTADIDAAATLAGQLAGLIGGIKLGLEFFTAHGPQGVRAVTRAADLPLFLDLKLHDIPNTVAGAVRSVAALRPTYLTIHAGGGAAMMAAAVAEAREAADRLGTTPPRILGVTVLTSLDAEDLAALGQDGDVAGQVARLADLARAAGLDGVVCSPREVAALRTRCGPDFTLMVPGIRPRWAAAGDQKRVLTPRDALDSGADRLVIGRPITEAPDPADAARRIVAELERGAE